MYKLSSVLYGHASDVRDVAFLQNDIVSCSRDLTAKLWRLSQGGTYENVVTYTGHKRYVNTVCAIRASAAFPDGLILTGCLDNCIYVFKPDLPDPINSFEAHSNTVVKLRNAVEENHVISASWDLTAKLWSIDVNGEMNTLVTFKGHKNSVWAVLQMGDKVLTGSGDYTINVYTLDGNLCNTLTGHNEPIRDLAIVNEHSFASCSNDATLKIWLLSSGECLNTIRVHSDTIYSVCFSNGNLISVGEEYTLSVYDMDGGKKPQLIHLPAKCIWTVACLPNGDIVTGAADSVIRIFSADVERQVDAATQAAFEAAAGKPSGSNAAVAANYKISPTSRLQETTAEDGETILIQEAEGVTCYCWSAREGSWMKMGEVTEDGSGASNKITYRGKEYDYVFDIDIDPNKPPLKLPYNKGENPWLTAQNFLHVHNLPQVFLDQVAQFILTNAGSSHIAPAVASDPLTGHSRYVPGLKFTPQMTCEALAAAPNPASLLKKLLEFNQERGEDALEQGQVEQAVMLASGNDITPEATATLKKLLNWEDAAVFPALDILRLCILKVEGFKALGPEFLVDVLGKYTRDDTAPVNKMLALRAYCNAMCHDEGKKFVLDNGFDVLNALHFNQEATNKNFQMAAATLALNLASICYNIKESSEAQVMQCSILLDRVMDMLPKLTEEEPTLKALRAFGTIVSSNMPLDESVKMRGMVILSEAGFSQWESVRTLGAQISALTK